MTQAVAAKPIQGVRKIIAQRMLESLHSTAQLSYHADADVTALLAQRERWKTQSHSISLEACIIFSLAKTLAEFPAFNGVASADSVTLFDQIDLSLAVATPNGLMTPVLRNINALDLPELAQQRKQLVQRALTGKLSVSEMKGGSFTISNLGHTRVKYFTPILNSGQLALLGVGSLYETLSLGADNEIMCRHYLPLSLTADHRLIDGDPAGRFLSKLCEQLEHLDKTVRVE